MNESIVRVLIDLIVFLEFSDDSTVDPDAAVNMMETVSARLSELSSDETKSFIDIAHKYASEFRDSKVRGFVKSLDQSMGLE